MTYQTEALVYKVIEQEFAGTITADKAEPDLYPSNDHHFYCPDCFELGHFTRLVRIKPSMRSDFAKRTGEVDTFTPAKFDLYDRTHSTHKCNHPVRFKEINGFERYNPEKLGDNSHAFRVSISSGDTCINTAKRFRKVLYADMYDEKLRQEQFFDLGNQRFSTEELFLQNTRDITGVRPVLLQPVARANIRLRNADRNYEIICSGDKSIECMDREVFKNVKKMTERKGGNVSAPVLVLAEPSFVHDVYLGDRMFEQFRIHSLDQITEWNYHTDFDAAIKEQIVRPFKRQMVLDLD